MVDLRAGRASHARVVLTRRELLGGCGLGVVLASIHTRRARGMSVARKIIHGEVEARGCGAELYVNDIPIHRVTPQQQFISFPVRQYLLDGVNSIELLVNPGSTPFLARSERSHSASPEASALARLVAYEEGEWADGEGGETLLETRWAAPDASDVGFPVSKVVEGDLGRILGPWAWQSADRLTGTAEELKAVEALIARLHAAFSERRAQPIIEAMKLSWSELHRAYPEEGSADEGAAELRASLAIAPENFSSQVLPLDRSRYSLRLCASGRLVQCVDIDWEPIIRTDEANGAQRWRLPIFAGCLKGEWLALR